MTYVRKKANEFNADNGHDQDALEALIRQVIEDAAQEAGRCAYASEGTAEDCHCSQAAATRIRALATTPEER